MSVKIDFSKDKLLDEFAIATLKDRYMVVMKLHHKKRSLVLQKLLQTTKHAQRLYDYVSKHWFMFATPCYLMVVQKRFTYGCFLNYIDDSREGITEHYVENAF